MSTILEDSAPRPFRPTGSPHALQQTQRPVRVPLDVTTASRSAEPDASLTLRLALAVPDDDRSTTETSVPLVGPLVPFRPPRGRPSMSASTRRAIWNRAVVALVWPTPESTALPCPVSELLP